MLFLHYTCYYMSSSNSKPLPSLNANDYSVSSIGSSNKPPPRSLNPHQISITSISSSEIQEKYNEVKLGIINDKNNNNNINNGDPPVDSTRSNNTNSSMVVEPSYGSIYIVIFFHKRSWFLVLL